MRRVGGGRRQFSIGRTKAYEDELIVTQCEDLLLILKRVSRMFFVEHVVVAQPVQHRTIEFPGRIQFPQFGRALEGFLHL